MLINHLFWFQVNGTNRAQIKWINKECIEFSFWISVQSFWPVTLRLKSNDAENSMIILDQNLPRCDSYFLQRCHTNWALKCSHFRSSFQCSTYSYISREQSKHKNAREQDNDLIDVTICNWNISKNVSLVSHRKTCRSSDELCYNFECECIDLDLTVFIWTMDPMHNYTFPYILFNTFIPWNDDNANKRTSFWKVGVERSNSSMCMLNICTIIYACSKSAVIFLCANAHFLRCRFQSGAHDYRNNAHRKVKEMFFEKDVLDSRICFKVDPTVFTIWKQKKKNRRKRKESRNVASFECFSKANNRFDASFFNTCFFFFVHSLFKE